MSNRQAPNSYAGYVFQTHYAILLIIENGYNGKYTYIEEEGYEDVDLIRDDHGTQRVFTTQLKYHEINDKKESFTASSNLYKVFKQNISNGTLEKIEYCIYAYNNIYFNKEKLKLFENKKYNDLLKLTKNYAIINKDKNVTASCKNKILFKKFIDKLTIRKVGSYTEIYDDIKRKLTVTETFRDYVQHTHLPDDIILSIVICFMKEILNRKLFESLKDVEKRKIEINDIYNEVKSKIYQLNNNDPINELVNITSTNIKLLIDLYKKGTISIPNFDIDINELLSLTTINKQQKDRLIEFFIHVLNKKNIKYMLTKTVIIQIKIYIHKWLTDNYIHNNDISFIKQIVHILGNSFYRKISIQNVFELTDRTLKS
jgi:hypothetical protein